MSTVKDPQQDPVSAMIRESKLGIAQVAAHHGLRMLFVQLNNGAVLHFRLDSFKLLAKAKQNQLDDWKLLPGGAGVHWPALDEHLSLRGFILAKMREIASPAGQGWKSLRKKVTA